MPLQVNAKCTCRPLLGQVVSGGPSATISRIYGSPGPFGWEHYRHNRPIPPRRHTQGPPGVRSASGSVVSALPSRNSSHGFYALAPLRSSLEFAGGNPPKNDIGFTPEYALGSNGAGVRVRNTESHSGTPAGGRLRARLTNYPWQCLRSSCRAVWDAIPRGMGSEPRSSGLLRHQCRCGCRVHLPDGMTARGY